ncbi:MAG: chromosomal replication initiator protein DnaA [Betaproteobacteria bacterium]|nr:chromosomal replication initiator protein DnaA [Betaproteobacteria bacterium]
MQSFWLSCLGRLEKELPAQQFNTWIRPLCVDAEKAPDGELRLVAPNRFVLQWVKDRFVPRIEVLANDFFSTPVRVSLILKETAPSVIATAQNASTILPPVAARETTSKTRTSGVERSSLISEFTFDNFVAGKANQLARAAAIQVSDRPGISYNPLFVYGGVGLGKTHLIHAIGNNVLALHPGMRVRYLHAAQYISDVVRAYQQKSFDEFKRYYHSLDLLLIDDIQFFTAKDRTQEEFFYAFNALIEAHKQVIITCDTYPKDLTGIDERLKSRFSWGLTVAIEPPEQEMRVAIILKKAEALAFNISEDVAFFVAKHIRSNVRELEGALKSVIAYSRFNGKEITLETAKDALRDLLSAQNRQITIENIQKTVADFYKIKVSDMHSKKRTRNVARPRQVAMTLAKDLTQMSLPDIGDAFGKRDHTTVLHACRTIAALREKDHVINRDYHVLEQVLKG